MPAAKYAGMLTADIEAALRADFDPHMTSLSIGPAGEHKLPWACVSNDQYHKAGRGGTGALMGSKNLKAIAVAGTGRVDVGDARAFLEDIERIDTDYILTDANYWVHEEGTPILVDVTDGGGCQPTRNYAEGTFEGAGKINSESFQKIRVKKRACYQCTLACRNFHRINDVEGEGPEYETIALCGSNCGVDDIAALMEFNHLCDEFGLDTISTGNVLGSGDGHDREGHPRLRRALRRRRRLPQDPRAARPAHRHRRRARPGHARPGREVRPPRAGHAGQRPRGARLRPARLVRHEHRLRHLRPRRLPHAFVPDRRRGRRGHHAGRHARRKQGRRSTSTSRTTTPSSSAASGATSGRSTTSRWACS